MRLHPETHTYLPLYGERPPMRWPMTCPTNPSKIHCPYCGFCTSRNKANGKPCRYCIACEGEFAE